MKTGLKSRNVDYVASSYMIVCQLVCVADMRECLLESLVRQIVKVREGGREGGGGRERAGQNS